MLTLLIDFLSEEKRKRVPSFLLPFLNGKVPRSYERLRQALGNRAAERSFVSELRDLANAWIESGKQGGVDDPFDRVMPAGVGKFTARHRPATTVSDGRVRYLTCSPDPSSTNDPESAARDYATYWFIYLLDSPIRERLSKCEHCGMYFLRERMPRRGHPIKRGAFCKKHRGMARARSMELIRKNRTDELERLAAKFWSGGDSQMGQTTRSKWVAAKMNAQLPVWAAEYFQNRNGTATGRWVTEHREDIEAEVERRKHATGKN